MKLFPLRRYISRSVYNSGLGQFDVISLSLWCNGNCFWAFGAVCSDKDFAHFETFLGHFCEDIYEVELLYEYNYTTLGTLIHFLVVYSFQRLYFSNLN